jgi:hypothetical protein
MFTDNIKIPFNIKKPVNIRKIIKAIIIITVILAFIQYFRLFFTTGIYYDDTFLKRESSTTEIIYLGKCTFGEIRITVQGIKNQDSSAKVIFQLPNNINTFYTVEFKVARVWDSGIQSIKDSDGKIVFEGEFNKESSVLIRKNGEVYMSSRFISQGHTHYDGNYKISLNDVAALAYSSNTTNRGTYHYLVYAFVFFIITAIDYKFPLFFFYRKHGYDVRNPEPSDSYLFWQRVGWFLFPLIGVVLMIVAL